MIETLLSAFLDEPTKETRAHGLEAAQLVSGEQASTLFRILVQSFPDGLSNNDLARISRFRINVVTARIMELRRVELSNGELLIVPFSKKKDPISGVFNVVWRVNPSYFEPSRKVVS